jgi:hypothetical protein
MRSGDCASIVSIEPHTTFEGKQVADNPSRRERAPMPPLMKRIEV